MRAWTWNGDCSVEGCQRECVDKSGLCRKHKKRTPEEPNDE